MNAPLKILGALPPIAGEVSNLIQQLGDSQARRRIADAWIAEEIDGDEAMELLIASGLIDSRHQPPPAQTLDLAEQAWANAREGFARMNREKDARRGLVLTA